MCMKEQKSQFTVLNVKFSVLEKETSNLNTKTPTFLDLPGLY